MDPGSQLSPQDWQYRAEGAANIVLSYCGADASLKGKVLRLRKRSLGKGGGADSAPGAAALLSPSEQRLWSCFPGVARAESLEDLLRAYAAQVMAPLLGPGLVEPGVSIEVPLPFLESVGEALQHVRPQWRQEEGQLDLAHRAAILVSDLTVLPEVQTQPPGAPAPAGPFPTFCVELKPKCGFLSHSQFISPRNTQLKHSFSRYTMHQQLKLKKGQSSRLSNYNPVDLFSGQPDQMRSALDAMLACPQNNIRVFRDGQLLLGAGHSPTLAQHTEGEAGASQPGAEGSTPADDVRSDLDAALSGLVPTPGAGEEASGGDRVGALWELLMQALQESRALETLLRVQELDRLDVEGILPVYHKYIAELDTAQDSIHDEGLPAEDTLSPAEQFASDLSQEERAKLLRDFLIAATAKDCGVMVAVRLLTDKEAEAAQSCPGAVGDAAPADLMNQTPVPDRRPRTLKHLGTFYEYLVTFMDLDLKRLVKIPSYYKLDAEIVDCFRASLSASK